jgi:acyl dehydratase
LSGTLDHRHGQEDEEDEEDEEVEVSEEPTEIVRGRPWQDQPVGFRFRTPGRTVTEHDLMAFVTLAGFNEPLFFDAGFVAEHTPYTGRLVPGALTYALAEGLVIQTHVIHGTGVAFLHMDLDVKAPVYVGDTLHVDVEVTESRSTSTPGRGLVTTCNTVLNQRGDEVLVYTPVRLLRGRDENAT